MSEPGTAENQAAPIREQTEDQAAVDYAADLPGPTESRAAPVRDAAENRAASDHTTADWGAQVAADTWRTEWGRLLGLLLRRYRRPDLAEDGLAEAFAAASAQWPATGPPANPAGWIHTVAQRRITDALRREQVAAAKAPLLAVGNLSLAPDDTTPHPPRPPHRTSEPSPAPPSTRQASEPPVPRWTTATRHAVGNPAPTPPHPTPPSPHRTTDPKLGQADPHPGGAVDDRLALLFMCTHPALAPEVRPALALRFVIGVPTDTIARLFLVPTPTMAARLTRAKKRLAASGIPFAVPPAEVWPSRLDDVARALYLAFTAGYAPSDGDDVVRVHDAGAAVRLALLAADLLPDQPVLEALAALLQLQHSRRDARVDADGELVVLDRQDRNRWHHDEITAGLLRLARLAKLADLSRPPNLPPPTVYAEELRLQAVIAAHHARAHTPSGTDWATIARTYQRLEQLTNSPVVRLNRAVAVAHVQGAMAGLALLKAVADQLPGHHRVALVQAELLRQDLRLADAASAYREALARCPAGAERRHIEKRLASLLASRPDEPAGAPSP